MKNTKDPTIIGECIQKWGVPAQIYQAVEELAELSVALLHFIRHDRQVEPSEVLEEIVDVHFMLEELIHLFDFTEEDIAAMTNLKTSRLREKLDKS